jgi:hypothetical protein
MQVAPALPVLAGILAQNADTEAMIDAMSVFVTTTLPRLLHVCRA